MDLIEDVRSVKTMTTPEIDTAIQAGNIAAGVSALPAYEKSVQAAVQAHQPAILNECLRGVSNFSLLLIVLCESWGIDSQQASNAQSKNRLRGR